MSQSNLLGREAGCSVGLVIRRAVHALEQVEGPRPRPSLTPLLGLGVRGVPGLLGREVLAQAARHVLRHLARRPIVRLLLLLLRGVLVDGDVERVVYHVDGLVAGGGLFFWPRRWLRPLASVAELRLEIFLLDARALRVPPACLAAGGRCREAAQVEEGLLLRAGTRAAHKVRALQHELLLVRAVDHGLGLGRRHAAVALLLSLVQLLVGQIELIALQKDARVLSVARLLCKGVVDGLGGEACLVLRR